MAPSTYYDVKTRAPSARARRDAVMGPMLHQLWEDNYCVYGARKLLKQDVARVMTSAEIRWPG